MVDFDRLNCNANLIKESVIIEWEQGIEIEILKIIEDGYSVITRLGMI